MANAASFLQTCRACAHEFRVPASFAGKKLPCPHCRRVLEVVAVAAVNEDKLVGKEIGGCKLVHRLGAGAIGVVYEAEQLSIGRRVAIKMLSSKAAADQKVVQRFQREAKLCAQIQHPNVVTVYDCGFERGVHFLVMEFVEGQTLAGLIEESVRLRWDLATRLILQVARGVEHAHRLGIIHRDIKPANILIGSDGTARLADLGLAKQLEEEGEESPLGLTMQGVALGSPAYMPPEQIRSAKDVTTSSDLYALGATFYQAVTGLLPFDGRTAPEVMTKVLREEVKPVASVVDDVPPAIAGFIARTLTKDPAGRPKDASSFIVELEDAFNHPERVPGPVKSAAPTTRRPATPSSPRQTPAPSAPSHGIGIGLGLLLAALLIGAVAVIYFRFFR